jgi:hypothetical protein
MKMPAGSGPGMPGLWSFYILSGRGRPGKPAISDFAVELLDEFGMLYHLLAQQNDQIQARRLVGLTAPPRQGSIGRAAFGSEGV